GELLISFNKVFKLINNTVARGFNICNHLAVCPSLIFVTECNPKDTVFHLVPVQYIRKVWIR
uniref:Uncharacterized protein n=1 Tax=Amphimedon queenslandica TaxID=400682 RepID=A0A1X7VKF5_AMPQE